MADNETKYGEKINLDDAQEMLSEYDFLKSNVEMKLKDEVTVKGDKELIEKLNVFIGMNEDYNAFVFTKDLIMRFFDGSERDADGNPQAANYLLVILGAHKQGKTVNDEAFKAGSFTVLTAGGSRKTEVIDGKHTIKFYPLSTAFPANEYPPTTRVRLKPVGNNKLDGNGVDYFEVI